MKKCIFIIKILFAIIQNLSANNEAFQLQPEVQYHYRHPSIYREFARFPKYHCRRTGYTYYRRLHSRFHPKQKEQVI